jgi:hypothetical protein
MGSVIAMLAGLSVLNVISIWHVPSCNPWIFNFPKFFLAHQLQQTHLAHLDPASNECHQREILVSPRNGRQQSINYFCATLRPSRVSVRPRRMAAVQLLSPILREPLLVKLT